MDKRAIGVFDSGVGGLSCVPALKNALPNEQIIFYGDSARAPYGLRSESEIKQFALEDAKLLIDKGCKALSIACNTISCVALDELCSAFPDVPVVGIVEPAAEKLAELYRDENIALIATDATVKNGAYERALKKYGHCGRLFARACGNFVSPIEQGKTGPEFDTVIKESIGPLFEESGAKVLALGCTHFPFIAENLKRLYPDIALFNPADALAQKTKEILKARDMLSDEKAAEDIYLCSSQSDTFARFVSRIK